MHRYRYIYIYIYIYTYSIAYRRRALRCGAASCRIRSQRRWRSKFFSRCVQSFTYRYR